MPLFSKYSTFLKKFFWLKSAKRPTSFNVVPPSERFSSLDFDDSEKFFRNNQGTWTMKRFWREFQLNHKTRTNRGKNNITVSIHSCEVRRSLQSNFFLNPDIDSLRWSETALAFSILLLINPTCVSWRRPFESWVVCLLLLPQPNSIPSSKNVPPFFLCPLTSPLPSLQRRLGLQVSRLSIAPGLSLIISLYGNQSSGFLFSFFLEIASNTPAWDHLIGKYTLEPYFIFGTPPPVLFFFFYYWAHAPNSSHGGWRGLSRWEENFATGSWLNVQCRNPDTTVWSSTLLDDWTNI